MTAVAGQVLPPVQTRVTRYEVCGLPGDDSNSRHFTIVVEYRGEERWAVTHGRMCLGVDGTWDFESQPSERVDEWLDTHRFDLETALRLAAEQAPLLTVNGHTIADVLAAERKGIRK
ncbi:hypothetical protein ACIBTV_27090 [Micromonospora sp. NPDC049366]|uniref:hypothetical protein n=1 Tax=Micromonospora sp. NPDC049366 TaxID=3364271 RepID=UPI0037B2330B